MSFLETFIAATLLDDWLERHGHDDARALIAGFSWILLVLAIAFIIALKAGWLDGFIRFMAGVE